MWSTEVTGECAAQPGEVYAVLADWEAWPEWNTGVAAIRAEGPFRAGTAAVMVFPDGSELPFRLIQVDPERGFDDLTQIADAGVAVRVRHELEATTTGTRITYRCVAEGPEPAASEVGSAVSADFAEVIAALGARAERSRG